MQQATDTASRDDPFDLHRFTSAQERDYDQAVAELRLCCKKGHWMWYIFPQIEGLGQSSMSKDYAIKSIAEARAYLNHPVLGARLTECAQAILACEGRTALQIFRSDTDEKKLRSSMTLFAYVAPLGSVFTRVLDKYFKGVQDRETLRILEQLGDNTSDKQT
ncbi:MAG: DUF1810 domain-containing protein [Herpetosiphonaceae bacterium]|nr:DUF1810 domain-containing protein [Herpetosiphonaceae bacterium]